MSKLSEIRCGYFNQKRFDFGVPLEDIFPPNDIHPRLKYLFEQAYNKCKKNHFNIEQLLREMPVPLEECLKLKEIILFQVQYERIAYEHPVTYFWLIRHFLGLLPVSLLPKYCSGFVFDWDSISKNCQSLIRFGRSNQEEKNKLDFRIAKSLMCLPVEHLLMFNVMIIFIRKVSQSFSKPYQLARHTLLCLVRYYCDAIFTRPYRPKCNGFKNNQLIPFLIYVTIRWSKIEIYFERKEDYTIIGSGWLESELITLKTGLLVQQNLVGHSRKYLKDGYSQTEEKEDIITAPKKDSEQNSLERTQNCFKSVSPKNFSIISSDSNETKSEHNEIDEIAEKKDHGNNENDMSLISFRSSICTNSHETWNEVVKETKETVKKVEGYIYDDYETFKDEEYNQISGATKNSPTFNDMLQTVWVESTPKKTSCVENEQNMESNSVPIHDQTYIKYPDVFTEEIKLQNSKSCNNSNDCLCSSRISDLPKIDHNNKGDKNKTNFNLKRFKMKFQFLRVFVPNKTTNSNSGVSNVKYRKISNIRAFTL